MCGLHSIQQPIFNLLGLKSHMLYSAVPTVSREIAGKYRNKAQLERDQ